MAEENPKVEENVEERTTIEETEGDKAEVKKTNEPRLARVEYDYQALESDELSLNIGDVVTVLEQGDKGGWWKGDLNGKTGIFPSNHVKLIEVPIQSAEDGEDSENPEGRKKKTLNKYGVKPGGIGSLFSGGIQMGLKKRSQPSPENSSVSEEKHAIASAPVLKKTSLPLSPVNQHSSPPLPHLPPKKKPPKPKKVEPMAEVIYDYEAEAEDEISLIQGTHVTILDKADEDGWWKVMDEQGKSGLCPSTYVKEIKQAEVQQKSQPVPKEVIKSNVEEIERHEPSEAPAMITQEVFTSEPASVSADSPIHSSSQETHEEDSPTLPTSPPPPIRSTTNETSPKPNLRSTYESSQAAAPQRRSTNESTSPILPQRSSSHDEEEHVTSRRPPSVVSPDLPPIQSISTKRNSVESIDTTISPEERPSAPPRQLSRSSSLYENKTDSPKSPPSLAKPPVIPKTFSPAKPPVVPLPPIKRSSSSASKSDKSKNETSPTEPISPKINRNDQYDASTALSEPEDKDDNNIEDEEQIEQTDEVEETFIEEKIDDKEAEISEEEEAKDDKEIITETAETNEDEDTTGGHEVEPEEKKTPPPQLPPLPSGPKLTNLGKDRPAIRNRKIPSMKSVKENASQSQTAILMEAVASAKDEEEPKPQPVASPPTPPKPEKPVKPNTFKLPTLGAGVQLRPVAKKPPIETSTESTETTTSSTASSGIDTKPISGGVKGISSRFNQFGGIPNSSDVELRLKKWFNEEINKVKSHFEAQLAEERSKREALEEEFRELIARLQE